MFKIWLKRYSVPILALSLLLVFLITNLPPKQCVLCSEHPYHAPALLNLSTGEIGELTVYDPHPVKGKALSDEQTTGTFSFLHCAGLIGYRDTANQVCSIDIPMDAKRYDPSHFCAACRKRLSSYTDFGFVIVDTYESENPIILPITDTVKYELRCYSISAVENSERNTYELTVLGSQNIS